MTHFELLYRCLLPFEHPLHRYVHSRLMQLARTSPEPTRLLDVGGRRSNYTIGVPAEVWISDLPREREIQHQLDLGATDALRERVLHRRSNIKEFVYDDMTRTQLPADHFSIVSAIEVLEHVEQDADFVANVRRVLRPGGVFVMTTPNGDFKPKPYPDHKRHYTADGLRQLLEKHLRVLQLGYRVNAGALFNAGVRQFNTAAPIASAISMVSYGLSSMLEAFGFGGSGPTAKHHIFALCERPD